MSWCRPFVGCVALALLLFPSQALCQFGGGGPPDATIVQRSAPFTLAKPSTEVALAALDALDREVELPELETSLKTLDHELTTWLGIPAFVDPHGLELAEIPEDTVIKVEAMKMPLRSALRKMLEPLSLRAVVQDEGLVITADFVALARRGIGTDQWISRDRKTSERFEQALATPTDVNMEELPLKVAIKELSASSKLPMIIDRRALEEIGLSDDQPVSIQMTDVPLRSILNLMLREFDLTYMSGNHVLEITTIEAAEQNLHGRIYWLEGTGLPAGDFNGIIASIQTTIFPETWEALGGPSTMSPIMVGQGNRPGLIVSTTDSVHHEIEMLLKTLRENHVGPDPIVVPPQPTAAKKAKPQPQQNGGGAF